ncbi:interleukin-31 [Onychomys torridus]|uniref:interleukin-31 n=1 Tax=Onychomys torridus TaxID=38674 RepID=UPI00167F4384|nr:interleukin-31 [Onychomys torridus]
MIFHTGPTKPALVVLCCIGTCLAICSSAFGAPTAKMIITILKHLKEDSKELYENYSNCQAAGIKTDESLQLPCFTLGCEASSNISTIKAYLEEVETLNQNTINTAHVRKRLDDIRCGNIRCPNPPKPSISGPEDPYERKIFTLTVFKRLSDCMAELKAKDRIC